MIIVEKLHKTFEDNHVLRGVSYHVHQGEKIVIVGPSGSGKYLPAAISGSREPKSRTRKPILTKSGNIWEWFFRILIYLII